MWMGFLDRINRMDRIGVRGASNGRGGSPLPPAWGWPWRTWRSWREVEYLTQRRRERGEWENVDGVFRQD